MKFKVLVPTTCLLVILCASLAQAQATRTWVSGVGDDVNPCSRTAPCKTWAGAISKTAINGEINALDPGGYGAVTITKSITLDGGGVLASILNSGSPGVIINATGPTDTVILRNIEIFGTGLGTRGINIIAAKNVVLQNVNIYAQAGTAPNGSGVVIGTSAANVNVSMQRVAITNNAANGIHCQPTGGNVRLIVNDSRIELNGNDAINLVANCKASIDSTSLGQNGGAAVRAQAGTTTANVSRSMITFNTYGAYANASSIWLFATVMNNNSFPIFTLGGGDVRTHQNNGIVNNSDPTLPNVPVGQQ
jgi:hypothetical protein